MASLGSVDLTDFDLAPALDALRGAGDSATDALRDMAYTAVGLGILTYQRAQVRRRELERQRADR